MNKKYDVIIVGAGPAGIFAALELLKSSNCKILIIEKGEDIHNRNRENPADMLCGWGGAGAFSDGKLNLSTHIGGQLENFISTQYLESLIKYIDSVYLEFGAPDCLYGSDLDVITAFQRKASVSNLKLVPSIIRHIGTENCFKVLERIRKYVDDKLDFLHSVFVTSILTKEGKVEGVETSDAKTFFADFVIIAPGREGAEWLSREAAKLNIEKENNPVDIGVRVEVLSSILEQLTQSLYESKFIFYSKSFDDMVRTFCMCPNGEVVIEYNNGVTTVNGHSYSNKTTPNTNFAILVSTNFTRPFNQPIAYGKYIASLANLLAEGVIIQRLGDLISGRRSTSDRIRRGVIEPTLKSATPGDLSFVLPYRHLKGIIEMIEALDKVAPGINSKHTLLYGVEVKFYSTKLKLKENLETSVKNLFAIGDGAGITRGLVQASVSGVIVGKEIGKRIE